jgi:hypothetical protein
LLYSPTTQPTACPAFGSPYLSAYCVLLFHHLQHVQLLLSNAVYSDYRLGWGANIPSLLPRQCLKPRSTTLLAQAEYLRFKRGDRAERDGSIMLTPDCHACPDHQACLLWEKGGWFVTKVEGHPPLISLSSPCRVPTETYRVQRSSACLTHIYIHQHAYACLCLRGLARPRTTCRLTPNSEAASTQRP